MNILHLKNRWSADGNLSVDKLLATKRCYVYGGLKGRSLPPTARGISGIVTRVDAAVVALSHLGIHVNRVTRWGDMFVPPTTIGPIQRFVGVKDNALTLLTVSRTLT